MNDKLSRSDVNRILLVEFIFYQHVQITPELVKAWHLHFTECSKQDFFAAVHIAVDRASKGFPPTPGEVKEILKTIRATPEELETADQAWAALWSNGGNASRRAIAAGRLMSDFANRRLWNLDSLPFKKKEFERIYDDLKDTDSILEIQNIARSQLGYGRDALPSLTASLMKELGCL